MNTPAARARPHLNRLLSAARAKGPLPVAVAYPCDPVSMQAVAAASAARLMQPVLVGPPRRIAEAARAGGLSASDWEVHATEDDPRKAAAAAVALVRAGRCRALMKGSLHSDELLAAALVQGEGLRGARRASHVFVVDVPGQERALLFTDCVVNIAPDLLAKRDIAQNAIDLCHVLGVQQPKIAILSAVETVNPAIPGTLDAAALCKMADRGQISGGLLDGPLAFDIAMSATSARSKGIASAVAGAPDVLLVPNLEAGNMLYKQLVYLAGADCAGVVLGLHAPVILTSRSDSVDSRVASCALAVLLAAADSI